ncbi:NHL repeat-containing protein [Mucilaginibacter sp. AW1-3]
MKKNIPALFVLSMFLFAAIFITGCSKNSDTTYTPIVPGIQTTNVIANVNSTSAVSGGNILYAGDDTVTVRGICWSSTNSAPTTADSKTVDPVVETSFTLNLTGLSAATTYYVRAFATSTAGTGYGSVIKFTTTSTATMPTAVVTTFAGSLTAGFTNGTGTGAQFNTPKGIAVDASGNLYIADSFNNAIRKVTTGGVVTTLAGNGTLGYVDDTGANAQFYAPQGVVADANGNVYVADYGNNIIRKITAAGVVSTLAGSGTPGYADGTGKGSAFKSPRGMAVDGNGNLYVADYGNNVIRKITSAGVVTTLAGYAAGGYVDSIGTTAAFRNPAGITIDATGANLYVADQGNHAIRKIVIATGVVTTVAGTAVQSKTLNSPNSIAMDANNNTYFIDAAGRIMELTSAKVLYTLAGSSNSGFANGTGAAALFNAPQSLAVYQGVLYVLDSGNNQIRKLVLQ